MDFKHSSRVELTYNIYNNDPEAPDYAFNNTLDDEIIEILSIGIVSHWLSAKALNSELLRNVMHNRDYNSYSPANLLREIRELRTAVRREYEGKIRTYSFRNSELERLGRA